MIDVRVATTEDERERLYAFRYAVYAEELAKDVRGTDHARRRLSDDLDAASTIWTAVDEGDRIVGTIRYTPLATAAVKPPLHGWLHLDLLFATFGAERLGLISLFMVAPDQRGRTIASLLVAAAIGHALEQRAVGVLAYAELRLIRLYYQLGMRPLPGNFRVGASGLRVPLVGFILDRAYLAHTGSPMIMVIPEEADDRGANAELLRARLPGFEDQTFDPVAPAELYAALAEQPAMSRRDAIPLVKPRLFDALTEAQIETVIRVQTRVTFYAGDVVYDWGDIEKGMGILLDGALDVLVPGAPSEGGDADDGKLVATLGGGDLFGEIAGLLDGRREARVVAARESSALLLPEDFIERVAAKDPITGALLGRNLARTLADRLRRTNARIGRDAG